MVSSLTVTRSATWCKIRNPNILCWFILTRSASGCKSRNSLFFCLTLYAFSNLQIEKRFKKNAECNLDDSSWWINQGHLLSNPIMVSSLTVTRSATWRKSCNPNLLCWFILTRSASGCKSRNSLFFAYLCTHLVIYRLGKEWKRMQSAIWTMVHSESTRVINC